MIYLFGDISLNVDRQELRRGADLVSVEPKVLDLLLFLIRSRERVVSKDDLIVNVWHGRIVSESTLTSRITAMRHAIGDSGRDQRFVRTIARKGLRFVGEVREQHSGAEERVPLRVPAEALERLAPILPEKPSIAVLPFTNMSGDPDQEFFGDGLAEDVLTELSKFRWLFVTSRNSSFTFKGKTVDARQASRELGVRYVLEGSVRRAGMRVRVTGQLIDAATDSHIWAEHYDRDLADIFAVQDEITRAVAAAIGPAIVDAERHRAVRKPPENLEHGKPTSVPSGTYPNTMRPKTRRPSACSNAPSSSMPVLPPRIAGWHSPIAWVLPHSIRSTTPRDAVWVNSSRGRLLRSTKTMRTLMRDLRARCQSAVTLKRPIRKQSTRYQLM